MSGIGNEATALTVGQQVEFLEDGLADEHFVAENQGFLECIATENLEDDRLRDADRILAAIGVFRNPLAALFEVLGRRASRLVSRGAQKLRRRRLPRRVRVARFLR